MGRRRRPYLGAAIVGFLGWTAFLVLPDMPALARYLLFAVIGFSAGGLIIGFAFAREVNHPGAAGTVGGVVNTSVLGIAAILQSALGWILDRHWQGDMAEGARVYDAAAYDAAFVWLAVSALGAIVSVALTRETHCRMRLDADGRKLPRRKSGGMDDAEAGIYAEIQKKAQLHAPSGKAYAKVFGIGFGKTGTTSLEMIFRTLGLRVPNQQEQERLVVEQLHGGNFQPLIELVGQYDAFQDKPFSQGVAYAQVDALFPGSKFILTVRDPDEWFDSLCRYNCKRHKVSSVKELDEAFYKDKTVYLYKNYSYETYRRYVTEVRDYKPVANWALNFDKAHFVDFYTRRNEDIIKYFDGREKDLLVIDLTKEKDVSRILDFLGFPQELNFPVPHLNRTDEGSREG
jgi:hypothetical protein